VDITPQINSLQNRSQQIHSVLSRSRTVVASADRLLITSWIGWFESLGPLVGAATSENETLACLESGEADLLICTDLLEGGSGPSLVRNAKQLHPKLKALMLVQRPVLRTLLDAIDAHCDGICAYEIAGSGSLLAALNAIESDGAYLDRVIAGVLRHGRLGSGQKEKTLDSLSLREGDVLRGLCKGMSNQEIADELYLSIDTVKSHVRSLLQKLPARDRTQAVVVAFRDGLIELPPKLPSWQ
jgi:DNA-binding NarL/FixJ family response regulator